ncbi:superoxide dismutase [Scheffersomyces coipomensis]|uniref:superoxide dismutase n=1 Tax=Scheffersomyces coipomensis TaxID=1788519 RepID=UPI00315D0781
MFFSIKLVYLISYTFVLLLVGGDNAPMVNDSPPNAKYIARFKPHAINGDYHVRGFISFQTSPRGFVQVHLDVDGLPTSGGPFPYHVHQYPVPTDGNCTGTGGHLDPYHGSATSPGDPAGLQVGDLAGRHGDIPVGVYAFETYYFDPFISLNPSDPAFIGGLSVVIHLDNLTRIACANITVGCDDH